MQRQRSSMGSLPDTISFDHSPTAADGNVEFWSNDIQNYAHNAIPEFITSSANGGSPYLNSSSQAPNLSGWNMGESSSSGTQNYAVHSEQKIEDGPSNAVPVRGVDLNQAGSSYSPLFMQSARNNPFPQDLNMGIEIGEINGNNRELVEGPSSGSGGYFGEEVHSSEDRRLSCNKRKVMEGHIGQSSSSGSSSYFQQVDEWNSVPGWYNAHFGSNSSSASLENPPHTNPSEAPAPMNVTPSVEPSRSRRRVRISSSPQQSPSPTMLPNGTVSGDSNVLTSPPMSHFVPRAPPTSSRWSRGGGSSSSSRGGYSLSFEERVAMPNEEESNNLQRSMSENPVFLPRNETRDPSQPPPTWGFTRGNLNVNISGSSSRSVPPISAPSGVSQRTPPRYSRRLSEFRRSMLSTPPVPESGGQSSNLPVEAGSSSQEAPASGSVANHIDRLTRLRSALLMERQLDTAIAGASSSRSAGSGSEGRRQLVSEIRNVLDLMRRGEGLRMEDLVILDQSVFFGRADIHDQHRDMRLDVDNMSYEELLALEERIGNVSTGLSEEAIMDRLKQRKFFSIAMGSHSEVEPCCICREEYNDGEDIGTVECGHEFHSGCIKQWLVLKNSCPICKTTALNK